MVLLLDCLKRRENWPDQFIAGLEACEHLTLAEEIRQKYNALRNGSSKSTGSFYSVVLNQMASFVQTK